jgi:hypothetical protein
MHFVPLLASLVEVQLFRESLAIHQMKHLYLLTLGSKGVDRKFISLLSKNYV